ncbi:MAG TPA: hypothetical protein V6C52_04680 [Coleofasciculaceae cyanobacterium]
MRKTLTLTVDEEMAQFINNQPGTNDPSALINKLFHEEMKRKGFQADPSMRARMRDEVIQEFELFLDANTHAAD